MHIPINDKYLWKLFIYPEHQECRDVPSKTGVWMRPTEKRKTHGQPLLGSVRLDLMLNMEHELVRLAVAIDWAALVEAFGPFYSEKKGRPGVPIRTMAGLAMLQHTFGLSDDAVVEKWPENPYWQLFCGEEFFQHEFPICASQMTRWRRRIGEGGVERLLKLTIEAGLRTKAVTPKQMQVVVVDTTVQPKAIEHPTDARLFRKVLHHLLRVAKKTDTKLRQSHRDLAKIAFLKHGRYMKAKQFKRADRERKKLKTYAGRVLRDLERKLSDEAFELHKGTMILSELVLTQEKKTKGKVYSMHAPETECIAKGKASKPYEFGVKTSLATTAKGGFVLGAMSCPGTPFDGHTLVGQLEQVQRLTGTMPKRCHVDKGYKGHGVDSETCHVLISGTRKDITKALKKEMKRRSSIEPEIGHQKAEGKLGKNWLKGSLGDALNAMLCGMGHNLRKILAHLRRLFVLFWAWVLAATCPQDSAEAPAAQAA
jgi:IS5 family transposase